MDRTQYLTLSEAAAVARLTPGYVRTLLRARRIEGVRPGGRGSWRISVDALRRYLGQDSEPKA